MATYLYALLIKMHVRISIDILCQINHSTLDSLYIFIYIYIYIYIYTNKQIEIYV